MKQRTLLREGTIGGKSLHTGQEVRLTLKPAEPGGGYVFRRVDLLGQPEIRPTTDLVAELVRSTDLSAGHTRIHTVEHVLSALSGSGVDNAVIEMDASEPPILDGSARGFAQLIATCGQVEQAAERDYYAVTEPIHVQKGNRSIIALPHDGLRITCTSADDRGIHTQHLSLDLDPEIYLREVAPARTFTIYEEIEELIKLGKIRGGSLDSAIVIRGNKIISKEPLRFPDEFVRHKILDIVGDITLLGRPLRAHIIAVRTGHALNFELTKAIRAQMEAQPSRKAGKKAERGEAAGPLHVAAPTAPVVAPSLKYLDIQAILNLAPHGYPFALLDRVVEYRPADDELTAIKNVTYNEPYFQGHFPGRPIMPGVLQLEAMAQAAGLLLVLRMQGEKPPVAYFMSADKVKFRAPVTPGDQIEIRVKLGKVRAGGKTAQASGTCLVGGKTVSSAEMLFMIVDGPPEEGQS